jgi:hypothetical protein
MTGVDDLELALSRVFKLGGPMSPRLTIGEVVVHQAGLAEIVARVS